MNFLAHLWLADRTGTSLAGSILGDVVRGADLSDYPAEIALGIHLHRRVDAATDRHPSMAGLRAQFPEGQRRYAGILLDIVADHALARQWRRHSSQTLDDFCRRSGEAIAEAAPWFERGGGRPSSASGFARLLRSYAEPAGIEQAIQRTAQRLRRPEPLLAAAANWRDQALMLEPELPDLLMALEAEMRRTMTLGQDAFRTAAP